MRRFLSFAGAVGRARVRRDPHGGAHARRRSRPAESPGVPRAAAADPSLRGVLAFPGGDLHRARRAGDPRRRGGLMRMFAVFKREYFQVVRKKSFLILTVLMPFLLAGLMIIPAALAVKGLSGKRVAVVDATGA